MPPKHLQGDFGPGPGRNVNPGPDHEVPGANEPEVE
ncbi:MAG: hypothetical protein ACI9PP_001601 [Halobacteriales archaeon]|jgi:hypothetical protein